MLESAVELAQPQSHKHECHVDSKSMAELNTDAASGGGGYADSHVSASVGSSFQGMSADQVKQFVSTDMLTADIRMKKAMSLIVDSAVEK